MADSIPDRVEYTLSRGLTRRLRGVLLPADLTPVYVSVIYLFFGFLALYFSDVYLPRALQDSVYLRQVQALKGGVEVVLTAGLFFYLTTKSRRKLQLQKERLNTVHAERSVLYRVFRHNLRQDINVILGYCDEVKERIQDEDIIDDCQHILDRVDHILEYQTKIGQIERILNPAVSYDLKDLSAVVSENSLVAELERSTDVSLFLDLPPEAPVIASNWIGEAVDEVLENAMAHSDAPDIEITIEKIVPGLTDLVITDNGPPIPDDDRIAINRMEEEQLIHSSGLGLWLAKLTCTASGGDLIIDEQTAPGNRVILRLPEASSRTIWGRIRGSLT